MLEIVVSRGGKELITLPLDRERFRIGRAPTNDLAIPDPNLSRHQCVIETSAGRLRLLDQSGRGTSLNGQPCKEAELTVGATLELGSLTLRIRPQNEVGPVSHTLPGGLTAVLEGTPVADPRTLACDWLLKGHDGSREIQVPLAGAVLSVGTDGSNDLVVRDTYVSAFHCRLYRKSGRWFVTDLDSTNGTSVNDVRVHEAEIPPGSRLGLGRLNFQVLVANGLPGERSVGPAHLSPGPGGAGGLDDMLSVDPVMRPVFEIIRRAAQTQETVLVTGESGCGKELVARALHRLSQRAERPWVPLNCSAITKELLESELFGHERGAFTGAQARRLGLFEEAHGGTLFLDEIGELPLEVQAKLLRVLESGEIRRVGASLPTRVDVRVIAATHRSLAERVRTGEFREDLYYRICVIEVCVPALRERPKDIPLLARHFLDRLTAQTGPRSFSPEALETLAGYAFPGNVRELKHVVTRAALLGIGEIIGPEALTFRPPSLADRLAESKTFLKGKTLQEVELETIRQALIAHNGNQRAAAQALGIARSTLVQKMEKYAIRGRDTPDGDVTAPRAESAKD